MRALSDSLREKSEALARSEQNLTGQVQAMLERERSTLLERARTEASEALGVELQKRDQQIQETSARLKESRAKELELLKQSRELEDRAEQLELEVARKLDSERAGNSTFDAARISRIEVTRVAVPRRWRNFHGLGAAFFACGVLILPNCLSVPVGIERTFPVAGMRFWKSVIPMLQLIG